MTDKITNHKDLMSIISSNDIDINFLSSPLDNKEYHNQIGNYDNLFWKFNNCTNFFDLLQKTEDELLRLRTVGDMTIFYLNEFLKEYNCHVGMFKDFTIASFQVLTAQKVKIEDLSNEEKTLSLVLIQCLSKQYTNDSELGSEIRKIFNQLKS